MIVENSSGSGEGGFVRVCSKGDSLWCCVGVIAGVGYLFLLAILRVLKSSVFRVGIFVALGDAYSMQQTRNKNSK